MEKREIFEIVFRGRGSYALDQDTPGSMHYTWLHELNACIEYVNRNCKNPPRIIVGFLHNPSMGAAADKFGDTYCIAVHTGLVAVLMPLFIRMLTSPNVLSAFGDCSREVVQKIDAPFIVDGEETVSGEVPKIHDSTRRILAGYLMHWVLRYIVLHENAHIVHGHVDYVYSRKSPAEWQSMESAQWQNIDPTLEQNSKIDPLFSQCLEYDADITANNSAIRYLLGIVSRLTGEFDHYSPLYDISSYTPKFLNVESEDEEGLFTVPLEQILTLYVFACATAFRVIGNRGSNKEFVNSSHSPASIRFLQFTSGVTMRISLFFQDKTKVQDLVVDERVSKTVISAIQEVIKAFSEISTNPIQEDDEAFLLFPLNQREHLAKLQHAWNEVRPKIEPFAYTSLAPIWDETNTSR